MTKKPLTPAQALNRLEALCSRSEYAESDCRAKLSAWLISHDEAEKIIESLINNKFVDDYRYAHAFTHDKLQFSGWGRIKIAYTLRSKGIPTEAIDEAFKDINEDTYCDTLHRLLKTKASAIQGKDYAHAYASLLRFAASRGFETALASKYISQILKDSDTQNDCDNDF